MLGLRYDRDIDTYGIDKQKNSRTHQELIAAAATGVPTVPTQRQSDHLCQPAIRPSLTNIGGVFTGLPNNDNLDISPRIGFAFDLWATAASSCTAVMDSTSARRSRTFRCS